MKSLIIEANTQQVGTVMDKIINRHPDIVILNMNMCSSVTLNALKQPVPVLVLLIIYQLEDDGMIDVSMFQPPSAPPKRIIH
jgi:hypothetical protein